MPKYEWNLPLPLCLFLVGLLVPPELSIDIAGIRLSAFRFLLLGLFVPMTYRLFFEPTIKVEFPDWAMLFVSAWCFLSLLVNEPLADAIEKGGILVVEMFGAYLIARIYIQNMDQFISLVKFLIVMIFGVLIFSLPESVFGVHLLRINGVEYITPRFGLHRAFGPFDHPILLGVVCSSAFASSYYLFKNIENERRWPALSIIGAATLLSLSAGPFLALGAQIGLIFWEKISARIPHRSWIAFGTGAFIYTGISIFSDRSPIGVLISNLTFNPQTAYVRLLIFEYGSAEVGRHPLFGIGYDEWVRASWMPPSVDNFWLLMAMRYGLPCIIGIAVALVFMALRILRKPGDGILKDLGLGWMITIAGLVLVGCTVHFWNVAFVLFFFLLGAGCWMLREDQSPMQAEVAEVVVSADQTYRPRQTLF